MKSLAPACLAICTLTSLPASAHEPPTEIEPLVVTGKAESLIGEAGTASEGQANAEELMSRPISPRGELLETVPGVVITQHSGDGKANQYFVRGFNLDHGTDFAITMDGQPVNFVTHAHGQGYADLNPIIPELVEGLEYWKGPFFAQLGDLSTAGGAKFRFYDRLPQGIASIGIGEHNFYRALLADTVDLGNPRHPPRDHPLPTPFPPSPTRWNTTTTTAPGTKRETRGASMDSSSISINPATTRFPSRRWVTTPSGIPPTRSRSD